MTESKLKRKICYDYPKSILLMIDDEGLMIW